MPSLPPLLPVAECAFFFDFDGTLVDLADTPDGVVVSPRVAPLLSALQQACDGAVAVVSGRPLAALDAFLGPLRFPAAGAHGAERREVDGRVSRVHAGDPRLQAMHARLSDTVAAHPGMLLETKDTALALHYRAVPGKAEVARAAAEAAVAAHADVFALQPGKMVYEIKPSGVDKGRAIETFLAGAPFANRRPVFLGDDLTDEKGFVVVNRLHGVSIKVGAGDTVAPYRLATVPAVLDWIEAVLAAR